MKLAVFIYAAVLAGLSGWMFAYFQRAVAPSSFGISRGIDYLMMAVAGGSGHVWGALAGAVLITLSENWLQDLMPKLVGGIGGTEIIVFGVGLVLVLQMAREGLWPHIDAVFDRFRSEPPPPADAAPLPRRALPAPGTPLLTASHLTKHFGGLVAVNDVSWQVNAGQIVGLIGPNGAGKSTTFNLVSGLARATSGEVTFNGTRIEAMPARAIARLGLARTFQHVKVVPDMTVLDNVALGATLRGRKGMLSAMLRSIVTRRRVSWQKPAARSSAWGSRMSCIDPPARWRSGNCASLKSLARWRSTRCSSSLMNLPPGCVTRKSKRLPACSIACAKKASACFSSNTTWISS